MSRYRIFTTLLTLIFCSSLEAQETLRGIIEKIDLKNMQIQLQPRGLRLRGGPIIVDLQKGTPIEFGLRREAGALLDLSIGQRVRVTMDRNREGQREIRIRVAGRRPPRQMPKVPEIGKVEPFPQEQPKKNVNAQDTIKGYLKRVSYADREINLIGPGKDGPTTETILEVPKDVKVIKDSNTISYDELADGQSAKIRIEKQKDRTIAKLIHVGQGEIPAGVSKPQARGQEPEMPQRGERLLRIAETVLKVLEQFQDEE